MAVPSGAGLRVGPHDLRVGDARSRHAAHVGPKFQVALVERDEAAFGVEHDERRVERIDGGRHLPASPLDFVRLAVDRFEQPVQRRREGGDFAIAREPDARRAVAVAPPRDRGDDGADRRQHLSLEHAEHEYAQHPQHAGEQECEDQGLDEQLVLECGAVDVHQDGAALKSRGPRAGRRDQHGLGHGVDAAGDTRRLCRAMTTHGAGHLGPSLAMVGEFIELPVDPGVVGAGDDTRG